MVLPILCAIGAALAATSVTSAAAKLVIGSELVSGRHAKSENRRRKREAYLGLNSEFAEFKTERKKKMAADFGNDPTDVSFDWEFTEIDILPEDLEPHQVWLAGKYFLTQQEFDHLVDCAQHGLSSVDASWLKELSERRRNDPEFRILLAKRQEQKATAGR